MRHSLIICSHTHTPPHTHLYRYIYIYTNIHNIYKNGKSAHIKRQSHKEPAKRSVEWVDISFALLSKHSVVLLLLCCSAALLPSSYIVCYLSFKHFPWTDIGHFYAFEMKMLCAINIIPDASLLKIKISIFFIERRQNVWERESRER